MCFNYKVSLLTFFIGTVFSFLLFKYGNKKYSLENKISGIFLASISLVQFMDFLLWIDIKNKLGINKITTILGPIIVLCQPILLFLIKYLYYKPNLLTFHNFNLPVAVLNLFYLIYFINMYTNFLTSGNLITVVKNSHLSWPWIKYTIPSFYLIILAVNIFYLFNFKYALVEFLVTYLFFYISVKYFFYNAGEIWCFFGSFIPLIMFLISFFI